jgi:ssDNA thymidine ADP-ribosyltransferase, DarT
MGRPVPTTIMHCTSVQHLPTIITSGLMSDVLTRQHGVMKVELGDPAIKERRRRKSVPRGPGGVVGDYVPFYFAAHNSMMYKRHKQGVDFSSAIFLVSSLETIASITDAWLVSDRNAADGFAAYALPGEDLDDHVDWPLMRSTSWGWSADDNERPERRMAECLVFERVPWLAIERIVTKNRATADEVGKILARHQVQLPVTVGPGWYF